MLSGVAGTVLTCLLLPSSGQTLLSMLLLLLGGVHEPDSQRLTGHLAVVSYPTATKHLSLVACAASQFSCTAAHVHL